ncbi:hypothetical protein ABK01_02125 [Treponema sp. OMZ 305]|nr:hypothetical protein ABK01_02125 [Treponema sp. OMZ 305]
MSEVNAYIEYNPNVFKGKTILLPCDDPEWSNFTKFFAQNFAAFGLKKLISTSYAVESKTYKHYQPSLFETESPSPIRKSNKLIVTIPFSSVEEFKLFLVITNFLNESSIL